MFMLMMLMMMKLEQVPTFFCSDKAMLTSTVNYHGDTIIGSLERYGCQRSIAEIFFIC